MKLSRNKATDSLYIEPNVIRDVGVMESPSATIRSMRRPSAT
jgi:hypothetical protein